MLSHQRLAEHSPTRQQTLLIGGFWLVTVALVLYQLLVVFPAYSGGLMTAYNAGSRLKDLSFPVPIYTPYNLVRNLLIFPVFLLIVFVAWIAPVLTIVWGVFLGKSWRQLSTRTKWGWVVTIIPLWSLTLATRTSAWALLTWLLD